MIGSNKEKHWWALIFVGLFFISFGLYLVVCKDNEFTAPILGLFTLGFVCFLFWVMKPSRISFQETSIEAELEKIEKSLRPYAIIKDKGNLLHSTFDPSDFKLISSEVSEKNHAVDFSLAKIPKFIEIRSTSGGDFSIDVSVVDGMQVYKCRKNAGFFNDTDSLIVEAYFK
ncbi:MAG: hypothetical protein R3A80_10085 [Bdellovibrionota bacterium]